MIRVIGAFAIVTGSMPDVVRAARRPAFPGVYVISSIPGSRVMARQALPRAANAWYRWLGLGILVVALVWHRLSRGIARQEKRTGE